MNIKTKYIKWRIGLVAGLMLLVAQATPLFISGAAAGTLITTFVQFNNMSASGTTTGTVCVNPATTSAGVKSWIVAFPTGFAVSVTAANWQTANISTTSNNAWPAGAVAWPNAASATASITGQQVTWTNAAAQTMNTGTVYCYNWTAAAALTQPGSPANNETGSVTTQTVTPTTIDTGNYATSTVTSNQVSVTGSVNPTFSMAFSGGSTDALGTLTTGAVASSSTVSFTVNSNAKNGWSAWVKDANNGLNSPTAAYTISSTTTPGIGSASSALTAGTEGYNMGVAYAQTSGSCTSGSAVPSTFAGAGGKGGSFNNSTIQTILACSGTTNTGVITPTNYAAINGATPSATDYADTETFVAAGLF